MANRDPDPKRRKLSLIKKPKDGERFSFLDDSDFDDACEQFQCKNTSYATKWAISNLESWKRKHNESVLVEADRVPDNLFSKSSSVIDHWMAHYVAETRNYKGEPYPPKTLYQLICGLSRYAKFFSSSYVLYYCM